MTGQCLEWMRDNMLLYLPKKERDRIRSFYEEYHLYDLHEGIEWGKMNTVGKLSGAIKKNRTDPYSKVLELKRKRMAGENSLLEFENNTLYVRFEDFAGVEDIVRRITLGRNERIILNLTGNSGGSVKEMLKVAGSMVTDSVLLNLKYRDHEKDYVIPGNPEMRDKKICVLTDRTTVSSGEILAYIIKEGNKNSCIRGCVTYGKPEGQMTLTDLRYRYIFSLTAFKWRVNGLDCFGLQKKYGKDFDEEFKGLHTYIKSFIR